jgi:hypothetical protein
MSYLMVSKKRKMKDSCSENCELDYFPEILTYQHVVQVISNRIEVARSVHYPSHRVCLGRVIEATDKKLRLAWDEERLVKYLLVRGTYADIHIASGSSLSVEVERSSLTSIRIAAHRHAPLPK